MAKAKSMPLTYAMIGGAEGSFIGPVHRMALRMDNTAILAAGCFSRNKKLNAATGAGLGIEKSRVYSSWQKLIEGEKGKIDFVSICTPNGSHREIAAAAIEAGFDVLCEKPLSMTAAEAEEICQLARRHKKIVGVPFTYSGYPMVKAARDVVSSGELGAICKVVLEYQQGSFRKIAAEGAKRISWKMDPAASGPSCVTADIGVHGFHLIEYVTGLQVESILSDLSSFVHAAGLDDDASILMRFVGGKAKASMVTSKVATGEENGVRIRVYGEKASLFWNQETPNELVVRYPFAPDRILRRKAPYMEMYSASSVMASRIPAGHPEGFIEAFANIYRGFASSVRSRKAEDFPTAYDGTRAMRFVDAVLKSNAGGNVWTKI
jgi:predicted dehydrogenase